jgi:GntR family transcriptional regulator/MocR family aminotransferase
MLYARRREALRMFLAEHLPMLRIEPQADAGMHLVAWLPEGQCDRDASRHLAEHGIMAPPLSNYSLRPPKRGALILGFAGWSPAEIEAGVRRMAEVAREAL